MDDPQRAVRIQVTSAIQLAGWLMVLVGLLTQDPLGTLAGGVGAMVLGFMLIYTRHDTAMMFDAKIRQSVTFRTWYWWLGGSLGLAAGAWMVIVALGQIRSG